MEWNLKRKTVVTSAFFSHFLVFLVASLINCDPAIAGCVKGRPNVCGDPNVCVSNIRSEGARDPNECLKKAVGICEVIKEIAKKFGSADKKIEVMSADRSRNCASRGGAGCGSLHASCRAVDLFVPGVHGNKKKQKSEMLPFLISQKSKHPLRYNIYCTGTVHVDNALLNRQLPDSYDSCVEDKVFRKWSGKKR